MLFHYVLEGNHFTFVVAMVVFLLSSRFPLLRDASVVLGKIVFVAVCEQT